MKNLYSFVIIMSITGALLAQGQIILPHPPEEWPPRPLASKPVYLKQVRSEVTIRERVANVKLEQIFYNPSSFRLEGEYLFPVPSGAQIYDFYLYMNGKKMAGEILDSEEASRIYRDIVRRMKDPALLEYTGGSLFRAKIFPIESRKERKIELSYTQVVSSEAGTHRFTLPIRQSGQGSIETYHLSLTLESDKPLGDIYSPSHDIEVNRQGEQQAEISFEATQLEGTRDFILYYSLSQQAVDATLLAFRPRTDRDGYFMLLASPGIQATRQTEVAKDVIFVIDVSGSMAGEKIEQARDALRYCVNTLRPDDRFEIITFSSGLESFQSRLQPVSEEHVKNARYFINNLRAAGGTNIDRALQQAFALKSQPDDRPTSLVFLTDGLPTEGETDIGRILRHVRESGKNFIRVFSFGVGYDVNTFLLDKLSQESRGSVNYVKPGENIERQVSALFAKISSPVLTDTQIDFGDLEVYDVYPQEVPDIFKGQRTMLFGRYRAAGENEFTLSGRQGESRRQFRYTISLPERELENDFIAQLWANRKVDHLLTQIRFHGESDELVESVRELGKEYGIVTPYTSYLVREEEKELTEIHRDLQSGAAAIDLMRMENLRKARESRAHIDEENVGSSVFFEALGAVAAPSESSVGKSAVMASRLRKKMATTDKDMNMLLTVKRVAGKTLYLRNGIWIEHELKTEAKADLTLSFLSDAYFDFAKLHPELNRILALGNQILFEWNGKIIKVVQDGN